MTALKVLQDGLAGAFDSAGLVVRAEMPEQEDADWPVLAFGDVSADLDPTMGDDSRMWRASLNVHVWAERRADALAQIGDILTAMDDHAIVPAAGWTMDAGDATLVESVSVERADEGYWSGTVAVASVLTED